MFFGAALIFLYVLCRAVLPLGCGVKRKILLGAGVFLLSFKFQLMRRIAGPMFFAPDLPNAILVAATWCYAVFFIFFLLLVAADLCRLARWAYRKLRHRDTASDRGLDNAVNLALLVVAAMIAAQGAVNARAVPELCETELIFKDLPPELDGFKIALLADLHVDKFTPPEFIPDTVRRVNALDPDLVAVVGDFSDGRVADFGPRIAGLKDLRAKYGVYGVPGNHEYYTNYRECMAHLRSLGIVMLENERRAAAPKLVVAGVTDPAAARYKLPMPDKSAALGGIPEGNFVLFLAHRPKCAPRAARMGANLQLSGHTHGGAMPFARFAAALVSGGFVAGLYPVGEMKLYVSRGTATWGTSLVNALRIRLATPPEITLIVLKRGV